MTTETFERAHRPAATADEIRRCPFDLVARAEFALHGCTKLVNSNRNGQPYTYAELHTDPPIAIHAPWDYADVTGRLLDAATLARIMTGSPPDEIDQQFARLLQRCQRQDGLIALPPDPWTHTAPVNEMEWSQRGALMAWTTRALAMDDTDARESAARLIHRLSLRAVWEGDTCWFPASYMPDNGWTTRTPPVGRMAEQLIGAQIIYPLARFAGAVHHEEALALANGLIRFLCERSGAFESDGRIAANTARYFHSITGFILGVVKYGLVADRPEYVEWGLTAYRSAKERGTEFGFFPHSLTGSERWQGDTCALKDMIEIAILLGLHKDPACLVDAERFGRNQLLEAQLLDFKWVDRPVNVEFCQDLWCADHPEEGVTTEDVCRRAVGSFSGWHLPNDAIDPANPRLMQRNTGAGTRALYDLWHYAVTRTEGAVMVHLHFSRDTRWATVTSYLPMEGRIDVLMKTRGVLAVRLPAGINDPSVLVNNVRPRHEIVRHGYAWIEALQAGDLVSLTWPLDERAVIYDHNKLQLTAHWRGDTLMRMNPPGPLSPLYQRPSKGAPARPGGAHGSIKEIELDLSFVTGVATLPGAASWP